MAAPFVGPKEEFKGRVKEKVKMCPITEGANNNNDTFS